MANTKELKNRIESVTDTQKITNAMYLIASTKLRKARNDLVNTEPYFKALKEEIERIFLTIDNVDSKFFLKNGEEDTADDMSEPGKYAYLVITSDKGLAGAYNQNAIKEAIRLINAHDDSQLYVVGEYGRVFFANHGYPIEQSFLYTAQNPSMDRAREITSILVDKYMKDEIKKIFIVYTDFGNGLSPETVSFRLLPLHRSHFESDAAHEKRADGDEIEYIPSRNDVLNTVIPSFLTGYIYSALVDSYCSEQDARMMAMDRATSNAQDILDRLNLEYNHVRQSSITQEIIEVSAGAKSQKLARNKVAK